MNFHSDLADPPVTGDLLVHLAGRDQQHDLLLARRQRFEALPHSRDIGVHRPPPSIAFDRSHHGVEKTYAIRGGQSGRDRLRILSALSRSGTNELLDRIGLRAGTFCLDFGCGGGEVTCELAKRVGTTGKAIGLDMDLAQLEIIRDEAEAHGISTADYKPLAAVIAINATLFLGAGALAGSQAGSRLRSGATCARSQHKSRCSQTSTLHPPPGRERAPNAPKHQPPPEWQ